MHTLFDFISSVNAIQYGLALLFIFGYIIFHEILRPKPFEGLMKSFAEDVRFMKSQGSLPAIRQVRNILFAPLYILFYLASLPFLFIQGITVMFARGIASVTSAGWTPVHAYFAGRKKLKKAKGKNSDQKTSD